MSHPWMPQPYTFQRPGRLTAPQPDAMGDYTQEGRAAGIFDDNGYATPTYVRDGRDGVNGLGIIIAGYSGLGGCGRRGRRHGYYSYSGFGADSACMLPEEAAAVLAPLVKNALVAAMPDVSFLGFNPKQKFAGMSDSEFVGPLTKVIRKIAEKDSEITPILATAIYWCATEIAKLALGDSMGERAADLINDGGYYDRAAEWIVKNGVPGGQICGGGTASPEEGMRAMNEYMCQTGRYSPEMCAQIGVGNQSGTPNLLAAGTRARLNQAPVVQQQLGPRAFSQAAITKIATSGGYVTDPTLAATSPTGPAAPYVPPPAAAAAGTTTMLLGAAAIAAFLFFK